MGRVYSLTGGYQVKNNSGRFYLGMRVYFGNYYEWGYLSSNFEYGTFFHASHTEQGVLTAGVNYFTGLFEIGKWKFRQFVKPQMTIGINRFSTDSLTLNDGYGLDGFNSPALSGTNASCLHCRHNHMLHGILSDSGSVPILLILLECWAMRSAGFGDSKVYSQIGLGVLIKNENLVFKHSNVNLLLSINSGKGAKCF